MKTDTKVKSQEVSENSLKVVREVTEIFTEADIAQKRTQLVNQQMQIKNQVKQLIDMHDKIVDDITACDEQLKQFEPISMI